MPWQATPRAVASAIAAAADFNKVAGNVDYLKGQDGAVELEGNVSFVRASGNTSLRLVNSGGRVLELVNDRAGNTFALNEESVRAVVIYDAVGNVLSVPNSPLTNLGLRVHRHPYASNRHLEAGTFSQAGVAAGGYADVAITFADAYTSNPTVVATPVGSPTLTSHLGVAILSISPTGCTIRVMNGAGSPVTITCCWVAEGPD